MSDSILPCEALRLNFPQDFLPERSLLGRLLAFAAGNREGDKQRISDATGIPTGKSTGKVEPMIRYARGMGLVLGENHRGLWRLRPSPLGELVVAEDPYLSETVTLWACHLLLCRRDGTTAPAMGIADAWFTLFAEGSSRLGNPFERDAFLNALRERHGQSSYLRSLSGLVPRAYVEASCLGDLDALRRLEGEDTERYERLAAPANRALYPAYALALSLAWDEIFPGQQQVALDALLGESRLLAVLHWQRPDAEGWIEWMRGRGLIRLDNLTGAAMVLRLANTRAVTQGLFDEQV